MTDYNWCHNPDCHTIETQSRVRGSGDNKVLRTIKINTDRKWSKDTIWDYFCNNNCLFSFLNKLDKRLLILDQSPNQVKRLFKLRKQRQNISTQ